MLKKGWGKNATITGNSAVATVGLAADTTSADKLSVWVISGDSLYVAPNATAAELDAMIVAGTVATIPAGSGFSFGDGRGNVGNIGSVAYKSAGTSVVAMAAF